MPDETVLECARFQGRRLARLARFAGVLAGARAEAASA
jgi:hypothetical protein